MKEHRSSSCTVSMEHRRRCIRRWLDFLRMQIDIKSLQRGIGIRTSVTIMVLKSRFKIPIATVDRCVRLYDGMCVVLSRVVNLTADGSLMPKMISDVQQRQTRPGRKDR